MSACAGAIALADADANAGRQMKHGPPWRAHDLLRLARLPAADDAPPWLRAAFAHAPFGVVRRAPYVGGRVPVGLRGATRAQRYGTWVAPDDIDATIAPEDLVARSPLEGRDALPAFVALALLRDTRSALHDFAWGPTGSAGFELATRHRAASAASDLDLLIRMPTRCGVSVIRQLSELLARASSLANTRIDAQLETPAGGVALAELATGKPRVLARATDGARLVADPWQPS